MTGLSCSGPLRREIVFTFPNIHNAMGGEKALLAAGITVRIMARPSALGEGCGICLRVNIEDYETAREGLLDAKSTFEAIYRREDTQGGIVYTPL